MSTTYTETLKQVRNLDPEDQSAGMPLRLLEDIAMLPASPWPASPWRPSRAAASWSFGD